jgi:3-phenylpropionate/trans-cinnamate dioxygenase ferredoxin subunit
MAVGEELGLVPRILGGEVVVLHQVLQQVGLYDTLVNASLEGIRAAAGDETAENVRRSGFDHIHEWVMPHEIPGVTDAVYAVMAATASSVLARFIPRVFPDAGDHYFERSPNVRFHIPYDLAAPQRRDFEQFARRRGDGKITAHGPHRDPWVDCPDNAINVWIAFGPVQRGNGLTVFTEDYRTPFAFVDGYVEPRTRLHRPLTFDLRPGDAVLFHGNHLHGSELNRTDRTRYVVSYRLTFGKPHYPHGHYHHYLHAKLAVGRFRRLAGIPQNLQASFFRYQFRRLRNVIAGSGKMTGADASAAPSPALPAAGGGPIPLADFPVESVRLVAPSVCVARLDEDRFVAVDRYCPHMGGDLAAGWIDEGRLVCPLHNLPFDLSTGASPCRTFQPLRRFPCEVRDDRVYVHLDP